MANAYIEGETRLTLRLNPNAVTWRYTLNRSVKETKGGRIVQLLGINLGSLSVQMDAGRGGYEYLVQLQTYFRNMALWHRRTKAYGTFALPDRDWRFRVLFNNISINDNVENVTFPVTINFNIQEDVSGVVTTSLLRKELEAIQRGIGYEELEGYNYLSEVNIEEHLKRYGADGLYTAEEQKQIEESKDPVDKATKPKSAPLFSGVVGDKPGKGTAFGSSQNVVSPTHLTDRANQLGKNQKRPTLNNPSGG